MRMRTILATLGTLAVALVAPTSSSAALNGTVKVGGVILDEEGDRSAVQETYNVYDGFSIPQISLNGTLGARDHVLLDLREINLDSRQGNLAYRRPGLFKLTAGFDQGRQVFDAGRGITSERKDWKAGARFTPNRWLGLSGQFGYLTRKGDRLPFPAGTASQLGSGYDNALWNADLSAEVRGHRRGGAVSYRFSGFSEDRDPAADRKGWVVSGRLYSPSPFYDRLTHLVRGAYGVRKLSNGNVDHTLASFQYTAVAQPRTAWQLKYAFGASRIDDDATRLKTDRIQNDIDAAFLHRYGRISAGFGYETNDDDRYLTSYKSWRTGATFHYQRRVNAKVDYSGRVKKDEEELTLLKDLEASRFQGKLELRPIEPVLVGGGFSRRTREFPDIHVESKGTVASAFARFDQAGWGSVAADYSWTKDDYRDLLAGFKTETHLVTARVEIDRIANLKLASGVTYLDINKDLDIEKSIVFLEAGYRLLGDYHLEILYNVYNYDDYILLDRYYTANVVRISLGYDLHLK